VNIVPWDEGLNDVTFNDQYYIAVDKTELVFYNKESDKGLVAITDVPAGWTVDGKSLPGWLSVVSPVPDGQKIAASGPGEEPVTLTLRATDIVDGPREADFYIVAGNLEKKITVRQLDEEEFSLEVSPWELTFYKTPQQSKTIALFPVPPVDDIDYSFVLDVKGNIKWTNDGIDPIISGNTVTLKPDVNDGATRGSTVLVTLNGPDGQAVTRAVNVRQLGWDMHFEAKPDNPYPAAGVTNQTFTVTSEAPWKFTTADDNGLTLLEDETGWHPATMTGYLYHFSLAANLSGFAPREVTVNVTSDNEEFAPRSFDVTQRGLAPGIDIIDPSSGMYSFGTPPATKEVKFMTNASWQYTTDADYDAVVSGANVEVGTVQPNAAPPTAPVPGSVTFTSSASPAGRGGSTRSTDVTFSTATGIGGVIEDSETVRLERTIPAAFTPTGVSPANDDPIDATATGVTVTANTNMTWWVRVEDGNKFYSADPTTYTTGDTRAVTIPARLPGAATSWTGNGSVTVNTGYDEQNGLAANSPTSYTFTQLPYTFTVSYTPTSAVTSVTITVETNAGSVPIRLVNNVSGVEIVGATDMTSGVAKLFDLGTVTLPRTIAIVNDVSNAVVETFIQTQQPDRYIVGLAEACPSGFRECDNAEQIAPSRYVWWGDGSLAANLWYLPVRTWYDGYVERWIYETVTTDDKGSMINYSQRQYSGDHKLCIK
jgi:hypothetical protein